MNNNNTKELSTLISRGDCMKVVAFDINDTVDNRVEMGDLIAINVVINYNIIDDKQDMPLVGFGSFTLRYTPVSLQGASKQSLLYDIAKEIAMPDMDFSSSAKVLLEVNKMTMWSNTHVAQIDFAHIRLKGSWLVLPINPDN